MTRKQFMEQLIEYLSDVLRETELKQTKTDHIPVPGAEVNSDSRKTAFGRRICVL